MNRLAKKAGGRRAVQPGIGKRIYDFIALVEHLPYGASLMQEKRVAWVAMGAGLLIMGAGSALFSVGWSIKLVWLVETAFIITLIGWMMLIISFAFWVVSSFAKRFPLKRNKNKS